MTHNYKILKHPEEKIFRVYIFTQRPTKLSKSDLIIYSNKLLYGCYTNLNLEEWYKYNDTGHDFNNYEISFPKIIKFYENENFQKEIYFNKNSFFATYKYTFPNILLEKQNTFIFESYNDFEPMSCEFIPKYKNNYDDNNNDKYKFIIMENLLR
jgi:hypothetical protein